MINIEKKNKLPTKIINEKIIDLNKASDKELEELQKELERQENEIRSKIDKILYEE